MQDDDIYTTRRWPAAGPARAASSVDAFHELPDTRDQDVALARPSSPPDGAMRTPFALRQGKPPKGYVRSDTRIHDDLCDRLMASGHDWSTLEVRVKTARVTLSGTVGAVEMRSEAERMAECVLGVREVVSTLRVGSPERGKRARRSTQKPSRRVRAR